MKLGRRRGSSYPPGERRNGDTRRSGRTADGEALSGAVVWDDLQAVVCGKGVAPESDRRRGGAVNADRTLS